MSYLRHTGRHRQANSQTASHRHPKSRRPSRLARRVLDLVAVAGLAAGSMALTSSGVSATAAATPVGIYAGTEKPSLLVDSDPNSVELGVRFQVSVPGTITAIRFYQSTMNKGQHVGTLWSATGTRLAQVSFAAGDTAGWQTAKLSKPIAVSAHTTYTASYHATMGHYSEEISAFAGGQKIGVSTLITGLSGVYAYGSSPSYPSLTWRSSAYYVDALFLPSAAGTSGAGGNASSTSHSSGPSAPPTKPSSPTSSSRPPAPSTSPTHPSTGAGSTPHQSPSATPPTKPSSPTSSSRPPAPSTSPTHPSTGAGSTPHQSPSATPPPTTGGSGSVAGFPTDSNTGIPAGTVLTAYTGPMTITKAGTVVDSKTVTGDLRIKAANVVVKNSQINGDVRIDADDSSRGYSFVIQDSNVNAGRALGQDAYDGTGIGAVDFTALRVNVSGGKLSINCFLDCTVQDSWLHDQSTDSTGVTHEGALRIGANSTIIHNSLLCNAPNVGSQAGCSGDLTGYGDFAAVQNDLIQNNYMMSETTGGGVCAYGGSSAGKPYSNDAKNIQFINNVFGKGAINNHGQHDCAYYFAVTDFDSSAPGNVFTGNVYTDGTPVQA